MGKKIIGYDIGTGGSKASLYDSNGIFIASTFVHYETFYPNTGCHEQRPLDWWNAIVRCTQQLLAQVPESGKDIECLSISGQSLGVVPVDINGELLREMTPIWSDTRAWNQAKSFFEKTDQQSWYMTTGNGFPPECYPVFKIMWYRDNEPSMFKCIYKVLGSKDFVNLKLTGKMCTDYSYASGSGVYNLEKWGYEQEFILASGLPEIIFPNIVPSTHIVGTITKEASHSMGLSERVKVICGGVDNSCMALGAGNIKNGSVYTSLGSSAWIAVSSRKPILDTISRPFVFAHVVSHLFTSAVSIFSAGSSYKWVRDHILCRKADNADLDPYDIMNEMVAQSPIGANKLLFNPSLAGGTSQEINTHIRGAFSGIDLRHTRNDLVRASMEGIAMDLSAVLEVLKRFVKLSNEMFLVGGGSKSKLWRQIFADTYNMDIIKTNIDQEAGSLGATAIAAVGAGIWEDFEKILEIHKVEDITKPINENVNIYNKLKPAFEYLRKSQAKIGEILHDIEL